MINVEQELFRVTPLQESIWLHEQQNPSAATYNAPIAIMLRGELDTAKLERAIESVVGRNEALRGRFFEADGVLYQASMADAHVPLDVHNWTTLNTRERRKRLYPAIINEVSEPFDLTQGPFLRAILFRLKTQESVLLLVMHHIVSDGWSQDVLLSSLSAAYDNLQTDSGRAKTNTALFYTYANERRIALDNGSFSHIRTFWHRFAKNRHCAAIAYDRVAEIGHQSVGKKQFFVIDENMTREVRALCVKASVSPFVVMLAVLGLLIKRHEHGANNWCIPVAVGFRDDARLLDVIGCFVDQVLSHPTGNMSSSVLNYVQQVSTRWQQTFSHRDYPFDLLRQDFANQGDPLVPSLAFVYQNGVADQKMKDLEITPLSIPEAPARFDLTVMIAEGADTFSLSFEYDSALYHTDTINALGLEFIELCRRMVTDVESPMQAVLDTPNPGVELSKLTGDESIYATESFSQLFANVVRNNLSNDAIYDEGGAVSYRELALRVECVATRLRLLKGHGHLVAVHMNRSTDLIVCLLAILTEGHCYVPLPPAYSKTHLGALIKDCAPSLVLAHSSGKAMINTLAPEQAVYDITQPLSGTPKNTAHGFAHHRVAPAYLVYTSGSTGQPKGVYGLAGGLLNRLQWQWQTFPYRHGERVLIRTVPMFVDAIAESLAPVLQGVPSVIAHDDDLADPRRLWRMIDSMKITQLTVVPSHLQLLLEYRPSIAGMSLRRVSCSGEEMSLSLAQSFGEALPHATLLNLYGSTEVTADATCELNPGTVARSIGSPIANTSLFIVDASGRVLPVGQTGEIAVSGAALSGGYHGNQALTAERFRPAPDGARVFLTGDSGRISTAGKCEFSGRLDHQIKVRGMRTDLTQIERVIVNSPDILDVIVAPDTRDSRRLVAYFVSDKTVSNRQLAEHAAASLPNYAVPSRWVAIREVPRTGSGKVDRSDQSIEAMILFNRSSADTREWSALEHDVVAIWAEVLKSDEIDIDDRFEHVGGHSLLTIRLLELLNRRLGFSLRFAEFLSEPTPRAVAAKLLDKQPNSLAPQLEELQASIADRHEPFPLLLMQQAYRVGRDAADSAGMSTICAFSMAYEDLSIPVFESALNRLIERHDMLRAVLVGEDAQRILKQVKHYTIEVRDYRYLDEAVGKTELSRLQNEFETLRFTPGVWPSFRITAVRTHEEAYRVYFAFDMLFIDLFSARILMRELESVYRIEGEMVALPPINISFRDYVVDVQAGTKSDEYARAKSYWLERVEHLPGHPELPLAGGRGSTERKSRFIRRSFKLPAANWERLKNRASDANVSPTSVLLGAYAATLGIWSDNDAFSLVLTLFDRRAVHPDVDKIVGDFTSSLVFGCEAVGNRSAESLFSAVQKQLHDAIDHRVFGGVEVLREMTRQRQGERVLLPVVFTSALGLPPINTQHVDQLAGKLVDSVTQTSHVWLDNQIEEDDSALAVNWDILDELLPVELADTMFRHYCESLQALSAVEVNWSDVFAVITKSTAPIECPTEPFPAITLHSAVLKTAQQTPERMAVLSGDRSLTYHELVTRARSIAVQLVERGAAPGERVGLLLERSWEAPVAMLAVSISGAAYVPIDPSWPEARRYSVLSASKPILVLTQPQLIARLPTDCVALLLSDELTTTDVQIDACAGPATPDDVAYVIYTSGSTGVPKGVVIDHRAVANTINSVNELVQFTANDRTLCLSALTFDLSVYDIWGPLFAGGACVMMNEDEAARPWRWPELIERFGVTLWNSVPALMELLIDGLLPKDQSLKDLRAVLLSGDWIPLSMPERVGKIAPNAKLLSLGGATEASIWSIYFPVESVDPQWSSVPYGRSLQGQQVVVMDHQMRRTPIWARGEIYISGEGLAREYWALPQKSAEHFIQHPESGEKLYRTGDFGCYQPGGDICFMGRRDAQVKLNGLRVELAEIESVLESHPAVRHALVCVESSQQLTAYVVLKEASITQDSDLNDSLLGRCAEQLPRYMVPSALTLIDKLPITANGKVDRSALPKLQSSVARQAPAARSGDVIVEPIITEMWELVLDVARPRKTDNFFVSGGDSLVAARLVAKINGVFGLDLIARTVFDYPTLGTLSEYVELSRSDTSLAASVVSLPAAVAESTQARFEPFALTDIQRSYQVGRRKDMVLGAVAAHSYIEIDYVGLDLERFEKAVNALIERHPMLRCIVDAQGRQRVLEEVPHYAINVDDVNDERLDAQQAFCEQKRNSLSRHAYDPTNWPLFLIGATRHAGATVRVHISLDIIIADAWSTNVLARDLLALYQNPSSALPTLEFGFRDFVIYVAEFQQTPQYERMRSYWKERLSTLPPPPDLPVRTGNDSRIEVTFTRHSATLDADRWKQLKERALSSGATPSAMLLTVFARVLREASQVSSFVINLTHFNRPPIHADINDIVGDFASTFLLECRDDDGERLDSAIGTLCRQILSDIDHSQYSGVRVLQDLSQQRGAVVLAPIVFTSALVLPTHSGAPTSTEGLSGEAIYALTQTPQVWLDHQVYQEDDRLLLAWDVRDDVFDTELVCALFELYVETLKCLSEEQNAWQTPRLPVSPSYLERCERRLKELAQDASYINRSPEPNEALRTLIKRLEQHPNIVEARAAEPTGLSAHAVYLSTQRDSTQLWQETNDDLLAPKLSPLDRLELKRRWMIREDSAGVGVGLPEPGEAQRAVRLARRSYRTFWGQQDIDLAGFVDLIQGSLAAPQCMPDAVKRRVAILPTDILAWIETLAAESLQTSPLPKYGYPSAGSCYAVGVQIYIPPSTADSELAPGWYQLDPVARRLIACGDSTINAEVQFESTTVLLSADLERIASLYGQRALEFAEVEAGSMIEVLLQAARLVGLSVCEISTVNVASKVTTRGTLLKAVALVQESGVAESENTARAPHEVRLYRQAVDGTTLATYVSDTDIEEHQLSNISFEAFEKDKRQLLIEIRPCTQKPGYELGVPDLQGWYALGAIGQRLMEQTATCNLGLCMIGWKPAPLRADGLEQLFMIVGPIDPKQRDIDPGDIRAERQLVSTLMSDYACVELDHINGDVEFSGDALKQSELPATRVQDEPTDLVDAAVRDIWADVLGVPHVSGQSNFFHLGGTSMDALSILRMIHERYFIELNLGDVMSKPTVDAMVELLRGNPSWSAIIHEVHAELEPVVQA